MGILDAWLAVGLVCSKQAAGRSQWLSAAITLIIFPQLCLLNLLFKKQPRFEGVERNISALTELLRLMVSRVI